MSNRIKIKTDKNYFKIMSLETTRRNEIYTNLHLSLDNASVKATLESRVEKHSVGGVFVARLCSILICGGLGLRPRRRRLLGCIEPLVTKCYSIIYLF